jgi:predicted aspartyl protease
MAGVDRKTVTLPIMFIEPGGSETDDHVRGSPCLDITFMTGIAGAPAGAAVRALIDTGADYLYLDRDLLTFLKSPPVRNVVANGVSSTVHQMTISLPSLGLQWATEVCALDVRAQGNGFDAILGRQFLQYGRLVYDVRDAQRPTFAIDLATLGPR